MDFAGAIIAAHELTEDRKLHRFPQHQPRNNEKRGISNHEPVRKLLNSIVMTDVFMS